MGSRRYGKYIFRVYSQDHGPMHVHVYVGSQEIAVIILASNGNIMVREAFGTKSEISDAKKAAKLNYIELRELWESIHG